ncbi:MAG: copper amine oxidase N-terminal domain-containing protein [Armatimonadetes bacterium]|nr:copper amine oxidase N-terminal domain-containing protein [Armatimonadota bacterium]
MSKRIVLMSVLVTITVSLAGMSTEASDLSWLTPFLYEGSSYVPLKSTASFLDAPLQWDANNGQTVITYKGEDLVLTPNSRKALYAGKSVELSSPPVVLNGVTYVPLETFRKYYNVPVTWDGTKSEIKIKGPNGWRTMKASSRPPWHGGPPPWALAWGQRGYGTPGYPGGVKASESGKSKALRQPRDSAPEHPSNGKANGNGKVKRDKKNH